MKNWAFRAPILTSLEEVICLTDQSMFTSSKPIYSAWSPRQKKNYRSLNDNLCRQLGTKIKFKSIFLYSHLHGTIEIYYTFTLFNNSQYKHGREIRQNSKRL